MGLFRGFRFSAPDYVPVAAGTVRSAKEKAQAKKPVAPTEDAQAKKPVDPIGDAQAKKPVAPAESVAESCADAPQSQEAAQPDPLNVPAGFRAIYTSRDESLMTFQDAAGHLHTVRTSRLA